MYEKDLTVGLHLRLSTKDIDFLRDLSLKRSITISQCVRGIIGDYRRSFDFSELSITSEKEVRNSDGNFKTNFNNKL